MTTISARTRMVRQLISAARQDPCIVGLVDYGSASEACGDSWSDVDVAVFVRDADFAMFEQRWKAWAAQFSTSPTEQGKFAASVSCAGPARVRRQRQHRAHAHDWPWPQPLAHRVLLDQPLSGDRQ